MFKTDVKLYTQKVEELIKDNNNRLIVNISDVRRKMPDRAAG